MRELVGRRELEIWEPGSPPFARSYGRSAYPGKPEPKRPALVVDATGVGRPIVNLLQQAGLKPIAFTITGGETAAGASGFPTVPKRDLVSTVQVLLQAGRLKVAGALRDQPLLVRELLNFHARSDPLTSHDSYGWREGANDDLVLAVALACWYGERLPRGSEWPEIRAGVG